MLRLIKDDLSVGLSCFIVLLFLIEKAYADFYQWPGLWSLGNHLYRDFITTMNKDGKDIEKSRSEFTSQGTEQVAKKL